MKLYYVYILQCADGSYYVGITNDLDRRVNEHNEGLDKKAYTYRRRPVELAYREIFTEVLHAIAWEKRLKGWSHAKKKAIINGEWDVLPELAECKNLSSHQIYHYIHEDEDRV